MWIKICGNTNLDDAQLATESGADAIGFGFAASPRQVNTVQVQRIVAKLPDTVERYGVFVDSSFAQIASAVSDCGLTGVQLHGAGDLKLAIRLREHFAARPERLCILQVLHWTAQPATKPEYFDWQLAELMREGAVDAVLVDSRTPTSVGGTGTTFDWSSARQSFLRAARDLRLIAAGGLRQENVRQAIETLRPWGVDVSSGVEEAPGKKDPARLIAFLRAARNAGAALHSVPIAVGSEL
jgi:phosphoribosylanthranilate isomerase